jgi:excisionase family DNA binding protein
MKKQCTGDKELANWITTREAAELTGYVVVYIRNLAQKERIRAVKHGRDWLIDRDDVLRYKRDMDALGSQRHNPWRENLAPQGRGRNKPTSGGNQ